MCNFLLCLGPIAAQYKCPEPPLAASYIHALTHARTHTYPEAFSHSLTSSSVDCFVLCPEPMETRRNRKKSVQKHIHICTHNPYMYSTYKYRYIRSSYVESKMQKQRQKAHLMIYLSCMSSYYYGVPFIYDLDFHFNSYLFVAFKWCLWIRWK